MTTESLSLISQTKKRFGQFELSPAMHAPHTRNLLRRRIQLTLSRMVEIPLSNGEYLKNADFGHIRQFLRYFECPCKAVRHHQKHT
jgi:hypothetical protein